MKPRASSRTTRGPLEARYLRVKNWERFQHYHNRPHAPYWIKLYVELLDDYEFNKLTERDRGRLLRIWLLASRLRNKIPDDDQYVKKAISATGAFALSLYVEAGWLEVWTDDDASIPASTPTSRSASRPGSSLEVEVEVEEKKNPLTPFPEKERQRLERWTREFAVESLLTDAEITDYLTRHGADQVLIARLLGVAEEGRAA